MPSRKNRAAAGKPALRPAAGGADRELVAEELRRQREEQEIILDSMSALVWIKDRDNRILRANRAAAESIQKAAAELTGASTYDLYPEEAAQYHQDDLEVIASGRPKLGIVEPLRTASGEQRWVRTDKIPYRDRRGEIAGIVVFAIDITDLKHAEAALVEARSELEDRVRRRTAALSEAVDSLRAEIAERTKAEERLELALWATDLGLWDWDLVDGRIVGDRRSAEMLGYTPEELAALLPDWPSLIHPDDRDLSQRSLEEHLFGRRGSHVEVEHRMRTKDGAYRWLQTRGKVVERDTEGRPLRIAGTHRDVTARKLIEERVHQQQAELAHVLRLQTLEGVAAELAHEINQPLGAIANFANGLAARLRRGDTDREPMLEAAEQIAKQAQRAAQVLQRLRDFTRKSAPFREPCDVNALARDAAAFVEPDLRRHQIALRLQLTPGLPPVLVDAVQIVQVILNLARNGVEAIADGDSGVGELTIETRAGAANIVEVAVHDTGAGLAPAAMDKLFDPFFTTKAGGLGMGLSISRSIVVAHGGQLALEPTPNGGTRLAFTLPAVG